MKQTHTTILSASWVFPVSANPVFDGAVVIEGSTIEAVGKSHELRKIYPDAQVVDCGNALIAPGLINLHSHLDFAALRFLDTQSNLFDWIPELMKSVVDWDAERFLSSATYGAQLAILSGTTLIVDSSYSGMSAEAICQVGLKGIVGLELFGLEKERCQEDFDLWLAKLEKLEKSASSQMTESLEAKRLILTCAPHAPYTVCPQTWQCAKTWADSRNLPLLSHLSESDEECSWFKSESKVVDDFLRKVMVSKLDRLDGIIASLDWKGKGFSPAHHLERHNLLSKNLLAAHCVKLEDDDIERLAANNVAVSCNPRSNARLRNGIARLGRLRDQGVRVGLGTDSLASNDDLDLIREARFALGLHRAIDPDCRLTSSDMLAMMTLDAARAIGQEDRLGSIEKGKQADLSVFKLDDVSCPFATETMKDPADLLIRFSHRVEAVYVDGNPIVEHGRLRNIVPKRNNQEIYSC